MKGRINENKIIELIELNRDNNGEYKLEAIYDSAVYAKKSKSDQLSRLYYLVSWKGYPEDENTWEPISAV